MPAAEGADGGVWCGFAVVVPIMQNSGVKRAAAVRGVPAAEGADGGVWCGVAVVVPIMQNSG